MHRRSRPSGTMVLAAVQVLATAVVAGSGALLYVGGRVEGLVGVLIGISAYRFTDDRRQDRLLQQQIADLQVHDLMAQVADVPVHSATPLEDVGNVCAAGAGVVHTQAGPRLLLESDLRHMSLDRCLRGNWERLSRPALSVSATQRIRDLDRLPRRGEPFAVMVGGMPLGVLAREALERAAARTQPDPEPLTRRRRA